MRHPMDWSRRRTGPNVASPEPRGPRYIAFGRVMAAQMRTLPLPFSPIGKTRDDGRGEVAAARLSDARTLRIIDAFLPIGSKIQFIDFRRKVLTQHRYAVAKPANG